MVNSPDDEPGANMSATTRPWVRQARQRARQYADRPERIGGLLDAATRKLKKVIRSSSPPSGSSFGPCCVSSAWYWTGAYRDVSRTTLITLLGAVIYFVMPIDAIPDWIIGIGFLDDAYVLGMAVKAVKGELDGFLAWEASR